MEVIIEDLSCAVDYEKGCSVGGGYAIPSHKEIHIDKNLPYERRRLVTVHEVLDYYLCGRVRHSKIDQMAIDVIDALLQTGFLKPVRLPNNEDTKIDYT